MKRLLLYTLATLFCMEISAQKITCADSLKVFYTKYLTYDTSLEYEDEQKLMVSSYCTKEFYDVWNEEVNDIGLYDPLLLGGGATPEQLDYIKASLSVTKKDGYYVVQFKFHGWQGDVNEITVYVYINTDGKISHTKRPKDGYMFPEK